MFPRDGTPQNADNYCRNIRNPHDVANAAGRHTTPWCLVQREDDSNYLKSLDCDDRLLPRCSEFTRFYVYRRPRRAGKNLGF